MLLCVLYLTEEPVLAYVLVNVMQVTSWLEVSSVGVEVIMSHSLLDAHTEAQVFLGEGVDRIHELSVIRRQSVCGRHAFKQGPRWIQTCTGTIFNLFTKYYINIVLLIRFGLIREHNYYHKKHSPVILPTFSEPSRLLPANPEM